MTPVLDTAVDIKGGQIKLATNPKKARSGKRRIKDADLEIKASTGDNKFMSVWPWMKLRYVCEMIT